MTQIICTIGPASSKKKILQSMAQNGMAVARLNFSYGPHSQHTQIIHHIRQLDKEHGIHIKLLQDLEGFRLRVGKLPGNKSIKLEENQKVVLKKGSNESHGGDQILIPFDYKGALTQIKKDFEIYMDDGNILLKVLSSAQNRIISQVVIPGTVKNHMGINIPKLHVDQDALSTKDKKDIQFGIQHQIDFIAQSFVSRSQNMINLRKFVEQHDYECPLIAKIENREGLNNLESILDRSEGIMIARGDLGVSIPIYEVPVMQKRIIRLCNQRNKIDITATQMLESMTKHFRPTRAEVSDVANAVLDGSDYVMLSGETAVGKHPVEAVQMMKKIIDFTLKNLRDNSENSFMS
ncbi:MAG: pyruvate kinase [Acidobacteriota bacterium]